MATGRGLRQHRSQPFLFQAGVSLLLHRRGVEQLQARNHNQTSQTQVGVSHVPGRCMPHTAKIDTTAAAANDARWPRRIVAHSRNGTTHKRRWSANSPAQPNP